MAQDLKTGRRARSATRQTKGVNLGSLQKVGAPKRAKKGLPEGSVVKLSKDKKTLSVKLPIDFRQSSTGKTYLIASTGGWQPTGVKVDGNELRLNANLTTRSDENPFEGQPHVEFDVELHEPSRKEGGKMYTLAYERQRFEGGITLMANVGYFPPR